MTDNTDALLHRLIGGDVAAAAEVRRRAQSATSPGLLVAAALLDVEPRPLLARAAQHATTTRDRQLVALAAAHLDHDADLLDALVRDHLAEFPDNFVAAWIAAAHSPTRHPTR